MVVIFGCHKDHALTESMFIKCKFDYFHMHEILKINQILVPWKLYLTKTKQTFGHLFLTNFEQIVNLCGGEWTFFFTFAINMLANVGLTPHSLCIFVGKWGLYSSFAHSNLKCILQGIMITDGACLFDYLPPIASKWKDHRTLVNRHVLSNSIPSNLWALAAHFIAMLAPRRCSGYLLPVSPLEGRVQALIRSRH